MTKFVSMHDINMVFDDIPSVDYITVSDVTDSTVTLQIYLKSFSVPKPQSKKWLEFRDRCLVLGKMIGRKVQFELQSMRIRSLSSLIPLCKLNKNC